MGVADDADPGVDAARGSGGRHLRPFRGRGRRQAVAHDGLADVFGVPGAEVHQAGPVPLGQDGLAVEVDVGPHPLQEEPAECPGLLRGARHLPHPPGMFPGKVSP